MLTTVVLLAAITLALKGAAALFPRLPDALVRRSESLAPALLAALVVTELVDDDGIVVPDEKLAAVAIAVALAWRRAPLGVCVVAGAAVAAILRQL